MDIILTIREGRYLIIRRGGIERVCEVQPKRSSYGFEHSGTKSVKPSFDSSCMDLPYTKVCCSVWLRAEKTVCKNIKA